MVEQTIPAPTRLIEKDRRRASRYVAKHLAELINHPIAYFNLLNPIPITGTSRPRVIQSPFPLFETAGPIKRDKLADTETGQIFHVTQLNAQTHDEKPTGDDARPLLYVPEYGTSFAARGTHQLAFTEIVRQTGRDVISIDYPGWGSGRLTKPQKEALHGEEGYGLVAEAQLRVLADMGITDLDIYGQSMGGFAAAAIADKAQKMGITVHTLTIVDPPLGKRSRRDLIRAELSEAKALKLYDSVPYKPQLREAAGYLDIAVRRWAALTRWGIGSTMRGGTHYMQAMANNPIEEHLRNALTANDNLRVHDIYTTNGRVSPPEENSAMLDRLGKEFEGRVTRSIYQGDSHAFMNDPDKTATFVRISLLPFRKYVKPPSSSSQELQLAL